MTRASESKDSQLPHKDKEIQRLSRANQQWLLLNLPQDPNTNTSNPPMSEPNHHFSDTTHQSSPQSLPAAEVASPHSPCDGKAPYMARQTFSGFAFRGL